MADVDPTTETCPDLPPIVDERAYQACRLYVQMIEARGVTADSRTEHGALLLKLRRACELYEQSIPPYARTLRVKDCACGECTECRVRAKLIEAGKLADGLQAQLRTHEFRLQKGRERIAELERDFASANADRNAERAKHGDTHRELISAYAEVKALKLALETTLVNQGAGTSEYARSQPSDACEIELWKAHAEGAWEDLEALGHKFSEARMDVLVAQAEAKAWREAWGVLGPQSPEEVATFDRVAYKVERDIAEHAVKKANRLEKQLRRVGHRLHVKRAEAAHWQQAESVSARLARNLWRIVRTTEHELLEMRAAHEAAIVARDDWHKLADERSAELARLARMGAK